MSTICVYGAAREDIDPYFIRKTEELGRLIGSHGYKLIYGAGASGLMGAVARGMAAVGGYIIGVTPHFMHTFEPVYECSKIIETKTMAQRKSVMEENADTFDLLSGDCVYSAPVKRVISKQELASKRAHTVYDRLVAAGNRLMRVIEQNKGGTNKEPGRFTDQIISLCEKYQR